MKVLRRLRMFLLPVCVFGIILVSVTGCSKNKNTPVYEFEEDADGRPDGWGVCEYPDGTIYEGYMSHGYFEGLGLCLVPTKNEGNIIRAADFIHSESPDEYNYAVEYYPETGQVIFGQNQYDALNERWTVTMWNDDPCLYTVTCYIADKKSKSGERERLRCDFYSDRPYEVVFTDDKGKQIDNESITIYPGDGSIEIGYYDNEEEGTGIWLRDFGNEVILVSTINDLYSCSGVIIDNYVTITVGGLNSAKFNGRMIEYGSQMYYVANCIDDKPNGNVLSCSFTENAYFLQEYDMGSLISSIQLEFPEGITIAADAEESKSSFLDRFKKSKSKTSDAARTGKMWIVGEGESYIDIKAKSTKDKTSYSEKIDKIMQNSDEYKSEHHSEEYYAPNATYRMFELLCVIAEEKDTSGTYASAVAESAMSRYKEMDDELPYSNFQTYNALCRCAEMLGSIIYELGGNESLTEVEEIFAITPDYELSEDTFMNYESDISEAVFKYFYNLAYMLDLPDSNLNEIRNAFQSWGEDMANVEQDRDKVIYNPGMRRFTGTLCRIYDVIYQIALGLDSTGRFTDDISEIQADISERWATWKNSDVNQALNAELQYYILDGAVSDASSKLLAMIARLMDPDFK